MADYININPVQEPTEVAVGETATFEYEVVPVSPAGILDPNYCISPNLQAGYSTEIRAVVGGSVATSETHCIDSSIDNPLPASFDFNFTGSQEGTVEVRIEAYGASSGTLEGEHTVQVDVTGSDGGGGDGGGGDVTNPDEGQDGSDGGDSGENPLDRLIETLGLSDAGDTVQLAALGVVVLVTIYVLGTLFDIEVPVGGGS